MHGAGSQRSDTKTGNIGDYPKSHGPQGDVQRLHNFVRLVRGGDVKVVVPSPAPTAKRVASTNRFVEREDTNRDGRVSRSEFKGPVHHFDHFDKNRDGFISADEAPTGPAPRK